MKKIYTLFALYAATCLPTPFSRTQRATLYIRYLFFLLFLSSFSFKFGTLNLGLGTYCYAQPGSLDTTFSTDGIQTTPIGSGEDVAYSVAI